MSVTYLDDRSIYEERYDKTTVAICRDREEMVHKLLGERPPLNSHGEAEADSGYYQYSLMYFHFVEQVAGERWQEREDTIRDWIARDEAKDLRLANATPATVPYCRSCGEDMQITHKSYLHRERGKKADEEDILFMFDCTACNKRVASWQDGTEWKPPQARCESCGSPVEETDKRRGNTITTTYTCKGCGHEHKSTMRLGGSATTKPEPDPGFKLDRRRFCFDAATGQKFLARQAHMEHIRDLLEKDKQQASGGGTPIDPVAEVATAVKRLKVAQVADLLTGATATAGYTEFKLGELQVGPELAIPFSCLDNQPERGDYDSRMRLKKLITTTLVDTNWRLMSEGIHHRLGYLSGRLRGYESEEELRKLAEKQLKGGRRTALAPQQAPAPEPLAQPEPPPAPKRAKRGNQRAVRARGILHQDLHILIPPRESPRPAAPRKKKSRDWVAQAAVSATRRLVRRTRGLAP
jgi:predicted RNA-binding Zn-ribbon protein involved in translation (DUF1610 family)